MCLIKVLSHYSHENSLLHNCSRRMNTVLFPSVGVQWWWWRTWSNSISYRCTNGLISMGWFPFIWSSSNYSMSPVDEGRVILEEITRIRTEMELKPGICSAELTDSWQHAECFSIAPVFFFTFLNFIFKLKSLKQKKSMIILSTKSNVKGAKRFFIFFPFLFCLYSQLICSFLL